jgi:hypothetical protein
MKDEEPGDISIKLNMKIIIKILHSRRCTIKSIDSWSLKIGIKSGSVM